MEERQTNLYLEHTQFQKCVVGLSWVAAGTYTSPNSTSRLKYVQDSVKSMTLVYQHTVSITSRWARIRVMQENLQHVPVTPLFHYQAFDIRHSNTIVKIFTFFYQIYLGGLKRPRTFSITTSQERAWSAIQDHIEQMDDSFPSVDLNHTRNRLTKSEELCHMFWLALIEQTGCTTDFELAVVTPLAFIAVDAPGQKFRAAYNFATDLAAFKKLARFAACQKLWDSMPANSHLILLHQESQSDHSLATQPDEAEQLICEQDSITLSQRDFEHENRQSNDNFKTWIYRYLTTEYMTPMSWIITTAHYISRFRYGETLDAFVRWSGDKVTVRDVSTTFDEYRAMVWTLYDEAEALLSQLTFTNDRVNLPPISWESIQCDPSADRAGYSPFLPTEVPFAKNRDFVKKKMLDAIIAKQHKASAISDLEDFEQVQRYSNIVQQFLQTLFLLIHFTSGQPGRLTEVSSIQIENTHNNGSRNIFMFEGHVAVVPRYHKGYNRDKSLKIIYRFLPRQVGALLVWFISLVRPFYQLINTSGTARVSPHYRKARSPFLWSDNDGQQFKSLAVFAELMKRTTRRLLGITIRPSLMRHLLIAFGRKNDKKKNGQIQIITPEELDDFVNDIESDAREMQAGHMPDTATAVYALSTHQVFRKPFSAPESNLKVSSAWHQSLGFETMSELVKSDVQSEGMQSMLAQRILKRGTIDVLSVLQDVMGPHARFRGQQRMVVDSIVKGTPVVSYIAGTGSGKSLAFFLPACCDGYGQTVVITPLVALRNDITQKCDKLQLTTSAFGQEGFNETDRVILAMPEHLSQRNFTSMLDRRRDIGQLERLVLDEFHYILLPDHEYRPLLLNIRNLAQFNLPITLLSGTVPLKEESSAYRLLGLEGVVTTFREPTCRTNVRYEVEVLKGKLALPMEDLAAYVRTMQQKHKKIIVYVAHTDMVRDLAELLQCHGYHGKMLEFERVRIQEAFRVSSKGVLVATIAINAGVDFHDIRAVLWLGEPDHPINWLQASGRAGRDSLSCITRIVLGPGIPSFLANTAPGPRKIMENILSVGKSGAGCLRVLIDEYLDGNMERICCKDNEEPCSYCASLIPANHVSMNNEPLTPAPQHQRRDPASRILGEVRYGVNNVSAAGNSTLTPRREHWDDPQILSSPTPGQEGICDTTPGSLPALRTKDTCSPFALSSPNTADTLWRSDASFPHTDNPHKRGASQGNAATECTKAMSNTLRSGIPHAKVNASAY